MSNLHHTVAIIPARGGSKRLPGKNIRMLAGKPLIAWSIEASLACPLVDRTIVSTDDEAIAKVALEFGAELHDRPADLATDQAGTLPVLQDVVQGLETQPDHVVLLQPTSPFRPKDCIAQGLQALKEQNGDALIGVSKCKTGPEWLMQAQNGQLVLPQANDFSRIRSQDQSPWFQIPFPN